VANAGVYAKRKLHAWIANTSGKPEVFAAQVFMIKKKKGILKLTGFGSLSQMAIPERERLETEDPGRKNNLNRRPNKQMREAGIP
jgi:hypothetical protein